VTNIIPSQENYLGLEILLKHLKIKCSNI